jgi:hypothetical protein
VARREMGADQLPVCPASESVPVGPRGAAGGGRAARVGRRLVAWKRASHPSAQGMSTGRRQVIWSRPERAGRAAMLISLARMVAPRALPCSVKARARVRLHRPHHDHHPTGLRRQALDLLGVSHRHGYP